MVMDLRNLFPWLQPRPDMPDAGPPGLGSDAVAERRFAAARDAALQSYRNRYGRPPSDAELEETTPHYLTPADRAVYERERAARQPVLARGVSVPPRMMVATPPTTPKVGEGAPVIPGALDRMWRYGEAGLATFGAVGATGNMLPVIARQLADPRAELQDMEEIRRFVAAVQIALAQQVRAYDAMKSDPRKSYETYTKERIDLGPCLFSQKEDPRLPCYYAGMTGGEDSAVANVRARDSKQYPGPGYFDAQVDCSTKSWVAARAREQQLIQHFRDAGVSDNDINSIADHLWRPYMLALAQQECGHKPLPPPRRRPLGQ